jgi:hypothetical protein
MNYVFIGDGTGVPGLPHEISDDEAKRTGAQELLNSAVANGTYAPLPMSQQTATTDAGKSKIKKGVTNGQ